MVVILLIGKKIILQLIITY